MEDVAAVPVDYRSLASLLPPMMVSPIWIEHALKVAGLPSRHQDQGFHRRLPFLGLVLDLWNFGYEIAGILGGRGGACAAAESARQTVVSSRDAPACSCHGTYRGLGKFMT